MSIKYLLSYCCTQSDNQKIAYKVYIVKLSVKSLDKIVKLCNAQIVKSTIF